MVKRSKRWKATEYPRVSHRNYSCPATKVAYPSRREAKRIARIMAGNGSDLLTPYECPSCGKWHLGHSNRRGF